MVNASDLPFDTAVKILQIYENLPKRDDFAFCIVCAEEKEAQSVFATAYNRYKKKLPQDIDYKKIQDYLYEHATEQILNGLVPELGKNSQNYFGGRRIKKHTRKRSRNRRV